MSPARIHRYILREIAAPMFLGLTVLTFVLLMGRILKLVEMVINKGVPLLEILKLVAFLLPTFLVLTLPLAFLLGVLIGFGRLSSDQEIVALKACGIGLYDMLKPVLVLALLVSLATAWLTMVAEPHGSAAFRSQVFQIATSRASVGLQPRVFNDDFQGLVLYADQLDERRGRMKGVFISDERKSQTPATILASTGSLVPDEERLTLTLRLRDGTIHRRENNGEETYQTVAFETYDISLHLGPRNGKQRQREIKESEMTLEQLQQAARQAEETEAARNFRTELHRRFVLPFVPLFFGLIAVPLGAQSQRSGRGGGFAVGLTVFLGYYLMLSFAETLAKEGGWPPGLTLWLPNLVFLGAGLLLVRTAAAEKRLPFMEWFNEGPLRLLRVRLRQRRRR